VLVLRKEKEKKLAKMQRLLGGVHKAGTDLFGLGADTLIYFPASQLSPSSSLLFFTHTYQNA
jgi:hypothetical protein